MQAEGLNKIHLKSVRKDLLIVYGIVVFLAFIVGKTITQTNPYIWLLLPGIFFGGIVLKNHRTAVVLMVVGVFLLDWLSDAVGVIPRQSAWLPELILMGLSFKVLFLIAKEKKLENTVIDGPLVLLIMIGLFSALLNSNRLEVLLLGFRNYFKFVLLFYAIAYLSFDDKFLQKVIKLFFLVAFAQVPVAITQRLLYLKVPSGDIIGGTLGSNTSGTLTLFLMCIISILTAQYINGFIKAKNLLISMMLLFIPMVINETKITFIIFPILLLFLFGRSAISMLNLRRLIVPLAFSVGIFYLAILSYNYIFVGFYQKSFGILETEQQVSYVTSKYTKSGSLNRLAQVTFAHENITNDQYTAAFGIGPGNASDSFFVSGVGDYFKKYEALQIDSTFLGRVIWEYGYLGLAVFIYMLLKLWILAGTVNKGSNDVFKRSIAIGFQGMLVVLAIAVIYSGSLIVGPLGCLFWFIAGSLQRWQRSLPSTAHVKVGV